MPFLSRAHIEHLHAEQRERLLSSHMMLGRHPKSNDVLLLAELDRYSGLTITGKPGSGKSGLLENMITYDASVGNAVIVLDPHLDLIDHCVSSLPPQRIGDTYVLDMTDETHPFGVNIFATGELLTDIDRTQAVERILHVFEVLWPDVLSQQNLPRYLRMATIVFLANPGKTLVDMYDFLLDDATRRQMLQAVTDPTVKQFWQLQYDALPPNTRVSRVQPLLGRLEQLFAGRCLSAILSGRPIAASTFGKP